MIEMHYIDMEPVFLPCTECKGEGTIGDEWCGECGGNREYAWDRSYLATLGHNLRIVGALFASFRAGDNFGFHMGSDESQCTCQWAPGSGEPYKGSTRCEQELLEEDDGRFYGDDCTRCHTPVEFCLCDEVRR